MQQAETGHHRFHDADADRDAGELLKVLAADGRTRTERLLDIMVRTGPYGDGFGADLDGLRRRTRVTMGRCQGFYCTGTVTALLEQAGPR